MKALSFGLVVSVVAAGSAVPVSAFGQAGGAADGAASATPSIKTRVLFEQRLDALPEQPLCWDVRTGSLAPGAKSPGKGFHTHGWVVAYVTGGSERVTYEEGLSFAIKTGEGILFAADKPHVHESIGTEPRTNIGFELTCKRLKNSVANSGALPGIRPGATPYQLQLRERIWPVGARTPVHTLSGPTTTYVLEGTIARTTASGTLRSSAGDLYVSPVGELAQNSCVSTTPCRTLDLDSWPSGETRSVAHRDKTLPAP